jgi:hypothetical protein
MIAPNHAWHVMSLPSLASPAAREFLGDRKRTVSVWVVDGMCPSVPTLGMESSYNIGISKTREDREFKEQNITDAIVNYLKGHDTATVKILVEIVRRNKGDVHGALVRHTEYFERTGETAKHGAELWRLKRGVG